MSNVKFLSPKVSHQQHTDSFSIVVSAKIERWKEAVLLAWVFAWTASGVFFVYQLTQPLPRETKMGIVILLFFWLYFELRVGRALMWRLWGYEQLRFRSGKFSVKRNIRGFGKQRDYVLANIERFKPVDRSGSFFGTMDESFWVVGGQRIYFEHLGKKVGVGMQLDEQDTRKLLDLLQKQLKKYRQ